MSRYMHTQRMRQTRSHGNKSQSDDEKRIDIPLEVTGEPETWMGGEQNVNVDMKGKGERWKMGVYIAHARKIGRQLRKQKQMKGNKRRRRGARGADKENDGQRPLSNVQLLR